MDGIKRAKQQILRAGRDMLKKGLVAATWGNISCKVEGKDCIAITPSGMEYGSLAAEDIVILDTKGNVVEGKRKPSTEMPLHLRLYKNREDIGAVVHTHSTYSMAFACVHKSIEPIAEELAQVTGGEVKVADYALPGSEALASNVLTALGNRNAVLLANHGLVGVAQTLKEALKVCEIVEKGAKITILCNMIRRPVCISAEDVQTMREGYIEDYGQKT